MGWFTYLGYQYGKKCAFCGTTLSVKYIVSLDSNYSSESVVSTEKVYACNTCVAKQIRKGSIK